MPIPVGKIVKEWTDSRGNLRQTIEWSLVKEEEMDYKVEIDRDKNLEIKLNQTKVLLDDEIYRGMALQDENTTLKQRAEVIESELRDVQHVVTSLRAWVKTLEEENATLKQRVKELEQLNKSLHEDWQDAEADLARLREAVKKHKAADRGYDMIAVENELYKVLD